ncbi:hypothetical protein SAMN02949497_3943 [Methylomagnum ishizawai]|uniref:Uncharacterized protein n=1 Tax=Methylomagnum ishizawai TaxID=1760988 RepID=A0A1Y6D6V2_9GAMM|nr:hypothetical protein [Methylomagnum ishizawai]SMF96543.1 hypothetical protein SAMN02949497_3943 [Methylomagnum ishizawai]
MRFFVTGEQRRQTLLNTIVLMFLGYIALLWISNGMMYFHKMGLGYDSVVEYYLGSEEKFTQPKSYQSLLEVTHFHLFAMGMLAVTLTHLLLFANLSMGLKIWLSGLTFASALADELAGWLVRFAHPAFAYFKIGAFLTLETSLGAILVCVGASLLAQRGQFKQKAEETQAQAPVGVPAGERMMRG